MTRCFSNSIVAAAIGVTLFSVASFPAAGQSAIPRLPDGKPDFNGVWDHPRVADMTKSENGCGSGAIGCKQEGAGELAYTPEGLAKWKDPARYDYTARCLPYGYLRGWGSSAPIEIVQTSSHLAIMFEIGSNFQTIPTDGRGHAKDLEPTWGGHSVGRYEGDTLVIDSVGFNEKTYLDTVEHPHSDQLHVIDRIRYIDPEHLSQEVTIEDPRTYQKPFKNTRVLARMKPGQELMEYTCMENNKELLEGHLVGH
jgi:hypothetical protein